MSKRDDKRKKEQIRARKEQAAKSATMKSSSSGKTQKPKKKAGKVSAASKRRMTVGFTVSALVLAFCFYLIGSTFALYLTALHEKQNAQAEYDAAVARGIELEQELKRMQDPEYLKQYAREKYFMAKDNEIIFMLPND